MEEEEETKFKIGEAKETIETLVELKRNAGFKLFLEFLVVQRKKREQIFIDTKPNSEQDFVMMERERGEIFGLATAERLIDAIIEGLEDSVAYYQSTEKSK